MRYLTSGFSHGKSFTAILEGLPAGLLIDEGFINAELLKRQGGYGRSERMDIEHDQIRILSGVIDGKTVGAPLTLNVQNRMHDRVQFSVPRPGHADFSGAVKYGFYDDLSLVAERASGRETVMAVAVGAVCKQLLAELGISVKGAVLSIGGLKSDDKAAVNALIDRVKEQGDTLGGKGEVTVKGVIPGFGSHVHRDRKLDGKIAAAIMSVPSVKAVEFGLGCGYADALGSETMDVITQTGRLSNNAGGIEGGMTNGEDIVVRFSAKPIPSVGKGMASVDFRTGMLAVTKPQRSDVCVIDSIVGVAESVIAFELLSEILFCLGGDTMDEVRARYEAKKQSVLSCIKREDIK